jgi:hypothetical protein
MFEKKGADAVGALTKAVREFDPVPMIKGFFKIWDAIKAVISVINFLSPILVSMLAIWALYKAVLIAVAIKQGILNAVMLASPIAATIVLVGVLIGVIATLARSWDTMSTTAKVFAVIGATVLTLLTAWALKTKLMAAAQVILNLAMNANPIFLIITGITLLVAAVVRLITKWTDLKKTFQDRGFFSAAKQFFGFGTTEKQRKQQSFKSFTGIVPEAARGKLGFKTRQQRVADVIKEREASQAPVTNRSVFSSITERFQKQTTDINIRNQSDNRIESGGKQIPKGSVFSPASG